MELNTHTQRRREVSELGVIQSPTPLELFLGKLLWIKLDALSLKPSGSLDAEQLTYLLCHQHPISINVLSVLQFKSFKIYIQNTNMLKICFSPHIADCNTHQFSQQTGVLWAHGQQARICMSVFHHQIREHRRVLDFTCCRRAHLLGTARNVLLIQRLIFLEMKCSLTQNSTLITGHRDKRGRKSGCWGLSSHGMTHRGDMTVSAVLLW